MTAAANGPDQPSSDATGETTEVTVELRSDDVARLDIAAARRGIGRDAMLIQAVDAFLAREMWSGGFIAPPPPMEPPPRLPWGPKTFRLRRRD